MWFLLDTSVVYTVSDHQFQPVLILTLSLSYSQSCSFGLSVDCFVVVYWCWISWRTEHNSSLCFLSSSVTTEEPETRQHRHTARHHPHRTLPHSGVWVSCEYISISACSCSEGLDLNYTHGIWICGVTTTVALVSSRTATSNSTWTTAGISWACITSRWAAGMTQRCQVSNITDCTQERETLCLCKDITSAPIIHVCFYYSFYFKPHTPTVSICICMLSSQKIWIKQT